MWDIAGALLVGAGLIRSVQRAIERPPPVVRRNPKRTGKNPLEVPCIQDYALELYKKNGNRTVNKWAMVRGVSTCMRPVKRPDTGEKVVAYDISIFDPDAGRDPKLVREKRYWNNVLAIESSPDEIDEFDAITREMENEAYDLKSARYGSTLGREKAMKEAKEIERIVTKRKRCKPRVIINTASLDKKYVGQLMDDPAFEQAGNNYKDPKMAGRELVKCTSSVPMGRPMVALGQLELDKKTGRLALSRNKDKPCIIQYYDEADFLPPEAVPPSKLFELSVLGVGAYCLYPTLMSLYERRAGRR